MSIKYLSKTENGQGLVETLIAVSVSIIVVTSLVSLAVFALRNSRQSSYTSQATQIARNQLEYLKAYRDNQTTSWDDITNMIDGSGGALNCGGALPATCDGTDPANRCQYSPTETLGNDPTATGTNSGTQPFSYYFTLSCVAGTTCDSSGGTVRANVYVEWNIGGKAQCIYNYSDFTNWRGK